MRAAFVPLELPTAEVSLCFTTHVVRPMCCPTCYPHLLSPPVAAVPLELMPEHLRRCSRALQHSRPEDQPVDAAILFTLLGPVAFALRHLLPAAELEALPQSTLPPRLAALLRATHLAPPRLLGCVSAVVEATLAWEEATGGATGSTDHLAYCQAGMRHGPVFTPAPLKQHTPPAGC
ncbi:hypothetical protein ABPG75_009295 [Micractinium tetrahymenae]